MHARHLMLLAVVAVAAFVMSSCKEDSYSITTEEIYTRNFIKEFGLIDPNQDWNLAKATDVTVNVGEHANSVKVYCKHSSKYYLVADLKNVSGTVRIPIDVPETSKDLYVKVDGKGYHTSVGATLDVNNISRSLPEASSTTQAGYTITSKEADWMYFNAQQIAPITADYVWSDYWSIRNEGENGAVDLRYTIRENPSNNYSRNLKSADIYYGENLTGYGLLPELNADKALGTITGNSNVKLGETEVVAQDFTIDPGDNKFIIYPMYWNTSRTHTLGIYLIDKDGDALNATGGKAASASDIAKFPIYVDKGDDDIQMTKREHIEEGKPFEMLTPNWSSLPSAFQTYLTSLSYDDYISITGNATITSEDFSTLMATYAAITSNSGTSSINEVATLFMAWYNSDTNVSFDSNHKLADKNWSNYTEFYSSSEYEITEITIDQPNNANIYWHITFKQKSSGVPNELIYESTATWIKASKIDLVNGDTHSTSKEQNAAYYTHLPLLMRSRGVEVDLGSYTGKIGMYIEFDEVTHFSEKEYNPEGGTSYAVSYKHPMSDRVYFSFEDWNGGTSDYDFNDLIFLIDKISKVTGTTEILVEPTPDPDDPEVTEETLSWLIAAEDLGATDDFDFNDVIFKLTSVTVKGEGDAEPTKQVKIKAMAAGGTLPVYLHYSDGPNDYVIGPNGAKPASEKTADDEWHKWFGNGYSSTSMINTGKIEARTTKEVTLTDINLTDFSVETYSVKSPTNGKIKGFYIEVNSHNSVGEIGGTISNSDGSSQSTIIGASGAGAAPQMFLIQDNGWKWPKERERIFLAYPKFTEWVNSADITQWMSEGCDESKITRPVQ